ncbi:MAG: hypothetical protein IIZ94_04840 [Prevotella sp.]|nr:hypothetical protein [Prevotella sp.]
MMRRTEKLERAVWCKGMCESIVCYEFKEGKTATEYVEGDKYLDKYVEELGKETVVAIMQDVLDNLVRIDEDVMRDSEGVSYNHAIFKTGYASERMLKDALYDLWDSTVGYKKN